MLLIMVNSVIVTVSYNYVSWLKKINYIEFEEHTTDISIIMQ